MPKCFHEIPAKSDIIPAALRLMLDGGPGYLHEHCDKLHRQLGSIFRNRLGPREMVFIADTKLIQYVVANEGQHPSHNIPDSWQLFNKVSGIERGLFFQVGKPWAKYRRAFSKVMLTDSERISKYSPSIMEINSDLLSTWSPVAGKNVSIIRDVKAELSKWSIEATGFMLFGQRLNCIPNSRGVVDHKASQLVELVTRMFSLTSRFQVMPVELAHKLKLTTWLEFYGVSENMIKIATALVDKFLDRATGASSSQSIVRDLIELNALTNDEITRSVIDLIIAAADTTSNSMQWMMHLLAKHPDVQEEIRKETKQIMRDISTGIDIRQSAPFLMAFIKEASRLYPTAPFLARTLDKDIELAGYTVPTNTPIIFSLFTTSRMEQYFDNPLKFNPYRWLRKSPECPVEEHSGPTQHDTQSSRQQAYASLPFGVGRRMCIGRRAAELQMALFIASLVNRFRVYQIDPEQDIKIELKMILCPQKPIGITVKTLT